MTDNLPAERRVTVNLGGPITDLDQAMRAADILSRSDLLPYALRGNAPNTLLVMLTGQELGLSLTQAFRTIYVPSGGQPQLRGVLVLAKLRQAGHSYKFEETEDSCKFIVTRGDTGEEYDGAFTIEDAITAKLAKRDANGNVVALSEKGKELPWMLYKRDLLQWRAVARGALRGAPEVMLGFEIAGAVPPEPKEEVQLKPAAPEHNYNMPHDVRYPGEVRGCPPNCPYRLWHDAQSPAPPGPGTGQAATGDGRAVQAELAKLDAQMREEASYPQEQSTSDPEGTVPQDFLPEVSQVGGIPESGGESAPEPETALPTVADAEAHTGPSGSSSADPVDGPVDEGKTPGTVLAELFTALGYDPKQYRERVLNACSVYTRRRIAGFRNLKAAEVSDLTSELRAVLKRSETSELHPVTILADQIGAWQDSWEREDPAAFAEYTGPQ